MTLPSRLPSPRRERERSEREQRLQAQWEREERERLEFARERLAFHRHRLERERMERERLERERMHVEQERRREQERIHREREELRRQQELRYEQERRPAGRRPYDLDGRCVGLGRGGCLDRRLGLGGACDGLRGPAHRLPASPRLGPKCSFSPVPRREDPYWLESKRMALEDRYRADFPRPDHRFHDFDHRDRGQYPEHAAARSGAMPAL